MSVAARLRKLEAPSRAVTFKAGDGHLSVAYEPDPLWPLLADLAEAAANARPPHTHPHTSTQIPCRACALDAALARVADQLEHEEGTT